MKVVALLLKYDYGLPSRGDSGEKAIMLPALQRTFEEVRPYWLEEHGYSEDLAALQRGAVEFARAEKPDFIYLVLMRYEIGLETMDALRGIAPVVNWFSDDQWRYESYSRLVAPHLSWAITTDKYALPKYEADGLKKVILTQWATAQYASGLSAETAAYDYEVSFVGGANATREWIVEELARRGIHVECFGSGWPNGRVSIARMGEIFHRTKINLNLSNSVPKDASYRRFLAGNLLLSLAGRRARRYGGYLRSLRKALGYIYLYFSYGKRAEALKARVFEIAGFCGFQISQFCLEVEDYFVPGREIALYSSVDELAMLVRYYLAKDDERRAICEAAYRRAAAYTYDARFKEIRRKIEREESDVRSL
jgi:spore maturation protein CgeB